MNKEIKTRVELAINNLKHKCNFGDILIPGAEIVYLLEKIEELQTRIDKIKLKYNKVK